MMPAHQFLGQFTTNFEHIKAKSTEINSFTVLYTHGLYSDPWGRKPDTVREWCEKNGFYFFRYELVGHGSDKDNYENVDAKGAHLLMDNLIAKMPTLKRQKFGCLTIA